MFSEIVKLVENSGPSIVISALVIYLFFKQYNRMEALNKQYMDQLRKQADIHNTHREGFHNRLNIAEKVNLILKDLSVKAGASRAYIFELHNTSNNLTGLPFAKFSMTYEHFEVGSRPVIHEYQNLSLSTLTKLIFDLYEAPYMLITNTPEDSEKYRSIQWFFCNREAKSVIFIPLKDHTGKIFGLAGFDFKEPQTYDRWTLDEMEKIFFTLCGKLTAYLDFTHHI